MTNYRPSTVVATFAAVLLAASPAAAMEAKQTVEREVVVQLADGSTVVEREPAVLVRPGDNVVYTLDFTNTTDEAATDLVLAMPVPSEVLFIDGSAEQAGTTVRYSTDGGQSFEPRSDLVLRFEDGSSRQADASDITHVRWTIAGPVETGESGAVSFRGQLR